MINKKCTKCHARLSVDDFVKDPSKKDGLYSSCKDCYRKRIGSIKRPEWHGKTVFVNGVKCRWCDGCQENKDCDFFYKRKNSRNDTRCKECVLNRTKGEEYRKKDRERNYKTRIQCIEYYSNGLNQCACCNEKEVKFLSIDHIDGGGNKHRKEQKVGHIGQWLRARGYPIGYQVLCHNCNLAKGFYGTCPHKNI